MTDATPRPGRRAGVLGTIAALAVACTLPGCVESPPPPVSPVVAADSEEARKALAEDQADRELRKQKEAKAASRKRKVNFPVEPE